MHPKQAVLVLALAVLVGCGGATTPAATAPTIAPAATAEAPATTAQTDAPTAEAPAATAQADAVTAEAPATTTQADAPTAEAPAATQTSSARNPIDLKGSAAAAISVADGAYFHLQTELVQGENKCLEGQGGAAPGSGAVLDGAGFMDTCQNVTGQIWKLVPQPDGYFHLQNRAGEEKSLCLEGNRLAAESLLAGAAVMNACQGVTGQSWRFVDAGDGFYHLQTKFLEADNKCLEGQGGAAPGSGAVLNGAAFMDTCQGVGGQRWKLTPLDTAGVSVATAAPAEAAQPTAAPADATAAPATEATAAPTQAAQASVDCAPQYASEIPKFKDAVMAEFATERAEATQRDGIARPALQWNDQLACQSQEWAQAIATNTYRQNPHCCYAPIPIHSNYATWKLGAPEGISAGKTAVEAVQLWRNTEMANFDFSASEAAKRRDHTCLPRGICGHYGAVIGLFTTEVGCGYYPDAAPQNKNNYNFVCQYVFKQAK